MRQILWAYWGHTVNNFGTHEDYYTRRLLTSTGHGRGWGGGVGGSGEDGSFGFSAVAGGTGAVAGASFRADFAAAVGSSVLVVARADTIVRVASAVPGTFVGATTHTVASGAGKNGKRKSGKRLIRLYVRLYVLLCVHYTGQPYKATEGKS